MVYHQRGTKSDETFFGSDETTDPRDSNSDLFDLEIYEHFNHDDVNKKFKKNTQMKKNALQKLRVFKLDNISIAPSITQAQHVVNLRQSFTFPVALIPSREIATQTSQINLMSNSDQNMQRYPLKRPASLPPENVALTNLQKRMGTDVKPKHFDQNIGDGLNNASQPEQTLIGFREPDLELAGQSVVQCVLLK